MDGWMDLTVGRFILQINVTSPGCAGKGHRRHVVGETHAEYGLAKRTPPPPPQRSDQMHLSPFLWAEFTG